MLKNLPSTEKILGMVWIISWILAIWMYHVQFFLTGLLCLALAIILAGRMDKNTKTLKVQKIYDDNLKWDEHEVCSGVANLPTGSIKEGDVVTNCKGNIAIRHIPSNRLIGGFDFEK